MVEELVVYNVNADMLELFPLSSYVGNMYIYGRIYSFRDEVRKTEIVIIGQL